MYCSFPASCGKGAMGSTFQGVMSSSSNVPTVLGVLNRLGNWSTLGPFNQVMFDFSGAAKRLDWQVCCNSGLPWDLSGFSKLALKDSNSVLDLGDSAQMDENFSKVLLEHHPSLAPSHNEKINSTQAIMHDNKKPPTINCAVVLKDRKKQI